MTIGTLAASPTGKAGTAGKEHTKTGSVGARDGTRDPSAVAGTVWDETPREQRARAGDHHAARDTRQASSRCAEPTPHDKDRGHPKRRPADR